jgi:hypothetical protein
MSWNQFLGSLNFKYRHWRAGTITLFQLGYYSVTSPHKFFKSSSTVFRIRHILVRILGSVFSKFFDLRLWIWIRLRILRFSSVTSKMQTKIRFFSICFANYILRKTQNLPQKSPMVHYSCILSSMYIISQWTEYSRKGVNVVK